jgi:hypothetical protein
MVCNFLLKQDTWTHYLYKLVFKQGFYYTGVRKRTTGEPLSDGYYGSPVTHKNKWKDQKPEKIIIALLWCEEGEQYELERQHQICCYDLNDPFCLNEHFGGGFSLEISRKGGRIGAQSQVEKKIGIHGMTFQERSIMAKERWRNLPSETRESIQNSAKLAWKNLPEDRKKVLRWAAKQRATKKWLDRTAEERTAYMASCTKAAKEKNTCLWEVLFPTGVLCQIENLSEFCREMGLSTPLMNKVSKGERQHHKGFIVRKVS